ncbi:MAG: putative peptidase [Rhizorhabdus sp.]|nr:putative peptidase [Rhizorhabdus sp.]
MLVTLLIAVMPMAAQAARPIEAFAALPFMSRPQLSPDGAFIASRMSIGGEQYIAISSLFDANIKPRILGLGDLDANGWQWVNDEWLLIWVGTASKFQGGDIYLSRLVSVSRKTGKINQLGWQDAAQNAANVVWIAHDGGPRILLARQTSIYVNYPGFWPDVAEVDVSTGRMHVAVKGREGVMSYYADAAGTVRMGYGYYDAQETARLLYRDSKKESFKVVDRARIAQRESVMVPRVFLPDLGQALVTSDKDGFDAVYRYDIRAQKLGERVFGIDGYDIDDLIETPAGDGLAGVALTDTRPRVHWIDPALAQIQVDLDKAVGAGNARIISWNGDQTKLIVLVGAPDRAGNYYYYALADGTMRLLAPVNPILKNGQMGPVSTIRYKARDGLDISAVLTLPKDRPAKNLPLIMLPHGGPQARDDEEWDWQAQFLADRGYAVIQPNYRGSTGFGTAFLDKGDGQWGLGMQDDLLDAIAHLAKQGIADPKRVCIMGGSYGGYAAMRAAERDGTVYRCAISFAGVSDLGALRRYDRSFLNANGRSRWLAQTAPDFALVSPIKRPQNFSIPILIIHGKKDMRVPVAQSREMVEKLKAAGKPVRYVEQPLGDHHFTREADRLQFLREVEAFLAEHNPA